MAYFLHIIVISAFFASLAVSLDLIVGQLGILSLCHTAFYATGAYTVAILITKTKIPFLLVYLLSAITAAIVSLPLSWIAKRLRHDSLVLASMSILLIILELLRNLRPITGGLDGIAGIPTIAFGGVAIRGELPWVVIGLVTLIGTVFIVSHIYDSPLGRSLRAYRDDPVLAVAFGIRVQYAIGIAFAISAAISGMVGGLYAVYASYINPNVFGFDKSILILAMVVLGGAATNIGPVLGALILVLIPEVLRFIGFESAKIGAFQQTLFGAALFVFAIWKPRGIMKGYRFR